MNRRKVRNRRIRWDLIWLINGMIMLIASIWLMSQPAHALVGVGEQIECFTDTPQSVFGNFGLDSNDAEAQTFILDTSTTISAVKINAYRWLVSEGWDSLDVHITDVSGASPNGAPDMNNIQASETWNTTLLPVFDQVTAANNSFSCDPDVDTGQVIIFDPPVALAAGQYAFVIEGVIGSDSNDMVLGYDIPANNHFPDGNHFECNIPTSCALLTPATWDLTGGVHDVWGMAWYDNVTIVSPVNFDAWITNFLNSIGMNSTLGKAAFAAGVGIAIMLAVLFRGGPPLFALAIGGMSGIVFVGATLLSASVLLSVFAIVGIAIIFGVIRGFRSGSDTSG